MSGSVSMVVPSGSQDRSSPMTVRIVWTADKSADAWYGYKSGWGGRPFPVQLQYRIGAGAWTYALGTWDGGGTPDVELHFASGNAVGTMDNSSDMQQKPNTLYFTFAANALTANTYEFQARTISTQNYELPNVVSAWSASQFVTLVQPPSAPTITSPAAGATVAKNQNISYSVAGSQTHAQFRVMNGSVIEWDSGEYAITTALSQGQVAMFNTNNVTRDFQVRTKAGGVWSAWATRSFNVSWLGPMTPSFPVAPFYSYLATGTGTNPHMVYWEVNSATPSGGRPPNVAVEVYARITDSGDTTGIYLGSVPHTLPATNYGYQWSGPQHGIKYDLRMRGVAADGAYSDWSAWTTVGGNPINIRGIMIHAPGVGGGNSNIELPLNFGGAKEERVVESALLQYAGREYPVVEYGQAGSDVIVIDRLAAEGKDDPLEQWAWKTNLIRNGVPTVDGLDWAIHASYSLTRALVATGEWTMYMNTGTPWMYMIMPFGVVGRYYAARMRVYASPGVTFAMASTDNVVGAWCDTPFITVPASGVAEIELKATNPAAGTGLYFGPQNPSQPIYCTRGMVMEVSGPGQTIPAEIPYFDGDTPKDDQYSYSWSGGSHASTSIRKPLPNKIDQLRELIERRVVLCYRDARSRRVYGHIEMGEIIDTPWGKETSLKITKVYPNTTPPQDVYTG